MSDLRIDGFLGDRLRIAQPVRGYRAGADAVMLAAACPAEPGQYILELGCGAGVASLCLGWRVRGLAQTGVERDMEAADLARRNAAANQIALEVITSDLAAMPSGLRARSFDHVIANPPYFTGGTSSDNSARALARQEQTPLAIWIEAALRRLRPGGLLTLIQRADRLDGAILALAGRAGDLMVLPVAARPGHDAGRVILRAKKGARGPMRLLAPFMMHKGAIHPGDGGDFTDAAQAVLREAMPISDNFTKVT